MCDVLTVEPLKDILEMYTDKNSVFMYYLEGDILDKISGTVFYEPHVDQLYIYDKLICIDKSTLKIKHIGNIINYTNNDITIKIKNNYCLRIELEDYYVFYKRKLKKHSKKDFMISLLKIL